jgi:hypothetical protein
VFYISCGKFLYYYCFPFFYGNYSILRKGS